MICEVHHLGLIDYERAWRLQETLAGEIASGNRPPTLLLLEHPHTYTFGRRGNIENLIWDNAELERRGIRVHWVDRGGDVTYHGPGQLVGYPLLPLSIGGLQLQAGQDSAHLPQADYVGYVRRLEQTLIIALAEFGITAGRQPGMTGVWIEPAAQGQLPAKIAAIGVKVDARGISRHGFALNVNPEMDYWQGIVGCGLKGYPVTSLAELLASPPSMDEVMAQVCAAFGKVFEYEMKPVEAG